MAKTHGSLLSLPSARHPILSQSHLIVAGAGDVSKAVGHPLTCPEICPLAPQMSSHSSQTSATISFPAQFSTTKQILTKNHR